MQEISDLKKQGEIDMWGRITKYAHEPLFWRDVQSYFAGFLK